MQKQAGFLRLIGLLLLGVSLVVVLFFSTSIGAFPLSGEDESRDFSDLGEFSSVRLRGSGQIRTQSGTAPRITITSDQNIIEKFTVSVEEDVLVVSMNELDLVRSLKLDPDITTISLTLPEIESLHVSGAYVLDDATLEGDELTFTTQGKTRGTLALTSNTAVINTSGHNDLSLTGAAFTKAVFTQNGTGTVNAHSFTTPEVDVASNGSSTLRLNNPSDARLELTGASKVFFETLPSARFSARTTGQSIIGLYDPAANPEISDDND